MRNLRFDLALIWLYADTCGVVERLHCRCCQPHHAGVRDLVCAGCGEDGPLLVGTLATADGAVSHLLTGWLTAHGWQPTPQPLCSRCALPGDAA